MTPTANPFQLGDPVTHRGIVVTPLFPVLDPRASYITLDEALPRGLVITETSDAGSVPELAVVNPLGDNVLLYDGEELVGAKQNRILNVSVLVGAGAKLPIPVSCVEQGRWARSSVDFDSATHISHAHLRRRKAETLSAQPLARGVAQSEVWAEIGEKQQRMSVASPTGAARDTFVAHRDRLKELEDAFPLQRGQCGAVLAIGGALCLDAVSRPGAFALLWPKLRAGYLLDALERLDGRAHPWRADRRVRRRDRGRRRQPRPLGRARQRRAAARPRSGRLRSRARRRAHPAECVHKRRRQRPRVRAHRPAEQAALDGRARPPLSEAAGLGSCHAESLMPVTHPYGWRTSIRRSSRASPRTIPASSTGEPAAGSHARSPVTTTTSFRGRRTTSARAACCTATRPRASGRHRHTWSRIPSTTSSRAAS